MPQRKSAKKELRKVKKRRQSNLRVKQKVKSSIKKFKKTIAAAETGSEEKALVETYKELDKAAAKKVIHKNKAARKKSRLSKLLKKVSSNKPAKAEKKEASNQSPTEE